MIASVGTPGSGTHSLIPTLSASSAIGSPNVIPSIQIRLTPSAETAQVDRFLWQNRVEPKYGKLGWAMLPCGLHYTQGSIAWLRWVIRRLPRCTFTARHDCHR